MECILASQIPYDLYLMAYNIAVDPLPGNAQTAASLQIQTKPQKWIQLLLGGYAETSRSQPSFPHLLHQNQR